MSALFSPFKLAETTFDNRIVVSPMCQYSAPEGCASLWHMSHLGQYAMSGAGLALIEATGVTPDGRITPTCLALYNDAQEEALARTLEVVRAAGPARIGIQLGHAGRKASCHAPWIDGGRALKENEGAWQVVGASPIAYDDTRPVPQALDRAGMQRIAEGFANAARRAARLGLDVVELHAAHGYLIHTFLSPLTNHREDEYGGSLDNRMRFPLEVAQAMRDAWPRERALGARINAGDFLAGGASVEDAIAFARALKQIGFDYVCASCGSMVGGQRFSSYPGYLLAHAGRIRREANIATQGVGFIVDPQMAERAVQSGDADMITLARAFLDDPRWVWHAADALGVDISRPPQYASVNPRRWSAAALRAAASVQRSA